MGELKMSRKRENVRCQRCGAWFNPKAYSGVLIEGKTLCEDCAKSTGWYVPITKRARRSKKKNYVQTEKHPEPKIDTLEADSLQPVSVEK